MTRTDLIRAIRAGDFDADLSVIAAELQDRKKVLRAVTAATNRATLKPGDRVKLFGLRPSYLNAFTGTVSIHRSRGANIAVDLDEAFTHTRYGKTVQVPAANLTAL